MFKWIVHSFKNKGICFLKIPLCTMVNVLCTTWNIQTFLDKRRVATDIKVRKRIHSDL